MRATPSIEISPPHKNPPLKTPEHRSGRNSECSSKVQGPTDRGVSAPALHKNPAYDRPDQLQRPRTPDLENSRKRCRVAPEQSAGKTAEKGAEWPPSKVPGKQPKNSRTGSQTAEKQLFCTLRVFFRLFSRHFTRGPLGTFFGCFSAVFKVRRSGPL